MPDNDTNDSTAASNNNDAPQNPPAQETTVIHAAAPGDSQSNANLLMILAMFVILLIGAAVAFTLKNKSDEKQTKKENLKNQLSALRGGDGNVLGQGVSLDAKVNAIVSAANDIRSDYDRMRVGYTAAQQELAGLKGAQKGNLNALTSLNAENTKLRNQNTSLRAAAANADSLRQQTQLLNERSRDLEKEIAKLRTGPTKESMKALQDSLFRERQEVTKLADEMAKLKRQMMGMVDSSKLKDLAVLRTQNEKLRAQVAALRTQLDFSKLFVKAHDQLPQAAQALFNELKTLEGKTPTELAAAYTLIGSKHKAVNMQRVKFKEGSALMNFKAQSVLKNTLPATAPTDYFLVVGYASTTGDAANNEKLSANRATAVASLVNQLKLAGQDVRAVYLGQTDRFSKTNKAENQLCEIWKISE